LRWDVSSDARMRVMRWWFGKNSGVSLVQTYMTSCPWAQRSGRTPLDAMLSFSTRGLISA
jgi:hypothetical protein